MNKAIILLLLASCRFGFCSAVDTNVTAIGAWSEPVRNRHAELRGRIVIVDAFVFIDLQECSGVAGSCLEIEWNPESTLKFELTNDNGVPVPACPGGYSGPGLPHDWLKMPPDSMMRLRASPFNGGGRQKDGSLLIMSPDFQTWAVRPTATNECFLAVTLSIPTPAAAVLTNQPHIDRHMLDTWQGTLKLPKVKIPVGEKETSGRQGTG